MVLSQDGIFNRAEQGADKYGQAKAREVLELCLGEAQMQKYESGLTDEQLTEKINSIGEEIKEGTNPNISQAIVDGYIFEVDRTVPKILDYIGPADGVIITATVTQNGDWQNPIATVTGVIKTYSGGTITTVSATKGGAKITGFSIDEEGKYTISDVTEDTTIEIKAKDSNNKDNSKTVPITIKIDVTPPTIEEVKATVEQMKIKITAIGHDKNASNQEESGIDYYSYEIVLTEDATLAGIPVSQRTGRFKEEETVTIEATKEATYTIKVTATDKCGNTLDTPKIAVIKTIPIRVTEIKIDKTSVLLEAGNTEKITVTILPSNATNKEVEWVSNKR